MRLHFGTKNSYITNDQAREFKGRSQRVRNYEQSYISSNDDLDVTNEPQKPSGRQTAPGSIKSGTRPTKYLKPSKKRINLQNIKNSQFGNSGVRP